MELHMLVNEYYCANEISILSQPKDSPILYYTWLLLLRLNDINNT